MPHTPYEGDVIQTGVFTGEIPESATISAPLTMSIPADFGQNMMMVNPNEWRQMVTENKELKAAYQATMLERDDELGRRKELTNVVNQLTLERDTAYEENRSQAEIIRQLTAPIIPTINRHPLDAVIDRLFAPLFADRDKAKTSEHVQRCEIEIAQLINIIGRGNYRG